MTFFNLHREHIDAFLSPALSPSYNRPRPAPLPLTTAWRQAFYGLFSVDSLTRLLDNLLIVHKPAPRRPAGRERSFKSTLASIWPYLFCRELLSTMALSVVACGPSAYYFYFNIFVKYIFFFLSFTFYLVTFTKHARAGQTSRDVTWLSLVK